MTKVIPLLLILGTVFPPIPDLIDLLPDVEFVDKTCPGINYPAITSVYDPALGGVNCDEDCGTVATGMLEDWMYEVAGACPAGLVGATIKFPAIDHTLRCVDKGGAIKGGWSERDNQCVVYFDTLWHLEKEGEEILGAPYWAWWYLEDWEINWND